ncbi:MAG: cob(I)yrinic acid a,c-diamide adenosyltransferase [Gluconacetobacter diazotrophicus]|nr:cob(I)yrinic acid a,c-diamide adenosyltransferase [Gluconacetobacter diazotrophicus]
MPIRIDQVVTRGGDKGRTGLGNGSRVAKDDPRVEAYGTVDECNAVLGLLRVVVRADDPGLDQVLARIQDGLFDMGGDLCVPGTGPEGRRLGAELLELVESETGRLLERQRALDGFVLPAGSAGAAQAHHWRTVLRRAERRVVTLATREAINPLVGQTLNRLSDFAFVLARHLNRDGADDVVWRPGARPRT